MRIAIGPTGRNREMDPVKSPEAQRQTRELNARGLSLYRHHRPDLRLPER